jgi:hypothetical protein
MPSDPFEELRRIAPLRDLPEDERKRLGVVREGKGRPRRVEVRPERDDYLDQLAQLRAGAAAADPLVVATDPEKAVDILDESLMQMARECSGLAFIRMQAEKRGAEVGALCSRRISGLVQIAALVVERHRLQPRGLDVRGEKFQKVTNLFMQIMREAAEETLGPDAERFLSAYAAKVSGWEDRVDPQPAAK